MKYLVFTLILSIYTMTQSFAVNSYPEQTCDSLKLTDGRVVAVQILKQTDDRIFFTLCEDEAKKEGIILKMFVESIIVDGKVIEEPAKSLKAKRKENDTFSMRKALKNGAVIAGIGATTYFLYKFGLSILNASANRLIRWIFRDVKIF